MENKFLQNDEYPPSEDTFFIANNIENEKGDYALDIGSGSGYLTKLLSKNFAFVVELILIIMYYNIKALTKQII